MRRRSEVFAVFKEASFDAVLMPMVAAARAGQLNLQILRRLVECRRCHGVEMLNADDAKEYECSDTRSAKKKAVNCGLAKMGCTENVKMIALSKLATLLNVLGEMIGRC